VPKWESAAIFGDMYPPSTVSVRTAELRDAPGWVRLRTDLWPETPEDHVTEIEEYFRRSTRDMVCFVAESGDGDIVGFAEVGTRPFAEGCNTSPVGYMEGIYVVPEARQSGAGRALVVAAEEWSRSFGCKEMASDRTLENVASGAFHEATGFTEANTIVCYRKELD
jgi:aminoglycoside 6'-N-acetyltransferase I